MIRKINMAATDLIDKGKYVPKSVQLDIFNLDKENETLKEDSTLEETLLTIKEKYGKSSVFKAMNLEEDATSLDRFNQIGGHHK